MPACAAAWPSTAGMSGSGSAAVAPVVRSLISQATQGRGERRHAHHEPRRRADSRLRQRSPWADSRRSGAGSRTPPPARAATAFNRVDDGFLRLDNQPGRCRLLQPRPAPAGLPGGAGRSRRAARRKCARLQDEVASLQREVAALRDRRRHVRRPHRCRRTVQAAPDDQTGSMRAAGHRARARLPVENAWRRLVDMIVDFQKDMMRKGRRLAPRAPEHARKSFTDHRGNPATDRHRDAAPRHAGRRLHRHHARRRSFIAQARRARARCWSICATPRRRSPSRRTPIPTCRPT